MKLCICGFEHFTFNCDIVISSQIIIRQLLFEQIIYIMNDDGSDIWEIKTGANQIAIRLLDRQWNKLFDVLTYELCIWFNILYILMM